MDTTLSPSIHGTQRIYVSNNPFICVGYWHANFMVLRNTIFITKNLSVHSALRSICVYRVQFLTTIFEEIKSITN